MAAPYPGIYRAKALRLDTGNKLATLIPQIFGEETITVTAFVGDPPAASEMGWVAFHGGYPEFPVWLGVGTGGGGGSGSNGVPLTRLINTTAPLTGGGDLSADRTLAVSNFAAGARGVVPASGGGTSNFLRADGTWVAPPGGGAGISTEDAVDAVAAALVEGPGIDIAYNDAANTITVTADKSEIGLDQVDNTSDANKPVSTEQATALLNKADKATTLTTTAPLKIDGGGSATLAASRTFTIDTFTATVKGAVPPPTTATGKYLKDDGTWATPAGADVMWVGPSAPSDAAIEVWYDTDETTAPSLLYVNKSGDTMTGLLNGTAVTLSGDLNADRAILVDNLSINTGRSANVPVIVNGWSDATSRFCTIEFIGEIGLTTGTLGYDGSQKRFMVKVHSGDGPISFYHGVVRPLEINNLAITAAVPVVLPANPTTALQAAPKQYVDVLALNNQTGTSYTLALTDLGKLVFLDNPSAIALTVPLNSSVAFPIGSQTHLLQWGVGKITVAPAGGVTVNGTPSLGFRARYSAATLIKLATDTWVLIGDLA